MSLFLWIHGFFIAWLCDHMFDQDQDSLEDRGWLCDHARHKIPALGPSRRAARGSPPLPQQASSCKQNDSQSIIMPYTNIE